MAGSEGIASAGADRAQAVARMVRRSPAGHQPGDPRCFAGRQLDEPLFWRQAVPVNGRAVEHVADDEAAGCRYRLGFLGPWRQGDGLKGVSIEERMPICFVPFGTYFPSRCPSLRL